MSVVLRKAEMQDPELLSELSVEIQEMHATEHPDFFRQGVATNYAVEFFKKVLLESNMQAWIAEVDGAPAGYMLLGLRDGHENSFVRPQSSVHVDHIAVLTGFQGQGVGRTLMEKAEQIAEVRGDDSVTLNVWAFNRAALGFYEQLGYSTYTKSMWKKLD